MKTLPLSKIWQPVDTTTMLLGMNPFVVRRHKIVLSRVRLLHTVTFASLCLYLTFYYFDNVADTTYSKYGSPSVMKFVLSFRLVALTAKLLLVLLLSRNTFQTVTKAMKNVAGIDRHLTKLGLQQHLEARNHETRQTAVTLLVVINGVFNTLGSVYNTYCKTTGHVVYFLMSWYPLVVVSTHLITQFVVSMVMKVRFEAINGVLSDKISESKKCQSYPEVEDFGESLDSLVGLHKGLVGTCEEVYANFSLMSLVWIVTMFVILTCDAYAFLHVLMYEETMKYLKIVFGLVKNCTNYIIHLYWLAKKCNDLCQEAQATKAVLLGVEIDVTKENERNCVIASALRLMENKLEITAWKLFNIDNTLLFSFCGAVFTYLFIMLQLDNNATTNTPAPKTNTSSLSN